MINLVFLCGGYPHQQLAFAISKLLYSKQSSRAVEGRLEHIYNEYSSTPFTEVLTSIKHIIWKNEDIRHEIKLDIFKAMKPLNLRLPLKILELLQEDKLARSFFKSLLDKNTCDTCFKDYYSIAKDPSAKKSSVQISNTISNWILKLENKIRNLLNIDCSEELYGVLDNTGYNGELIDRDSCVSCKLRKLPPCSEQQYAAVYSSIQQKMEVISHE
ncbi:MAG: hypothetical protein ACOZCL_04465 [Bacillota bacterium]